MVQSCPHPISALIQSKLKETLFLCWPFACCQASPQLGPEVHREESPLEAIQQIGIQSGKNINR